MHLNIFKWTERNPLAQRELRTFPRVVSFIVNWVSSPIAQNSWNKINKKQNKKQNVNFMLVFMLVQVQIVWNIGFSLFTVSKLQATFVIAVNQ